MPAPASGQSNRFYTREYFRQCAEKLRPGGVFAFRLPSSENLWTEFLSYRNTSIYLSLRSVFQDALVLPGVTNTLLASNAPLTREPATLVKRLRDRKVKTRFITPEYINYLYTNDRFFEIKKRLESTTAPPNTDIRPVCYQYSSMIWLSKFIPQMINQDLAFFGISDLPWIGIYSIVGIFFGGLFLLIRCWPRFKRISLVVVAGFSGMVVETMLILYYQTKSGVLFQNIGILLMMFMAGLAAGAIIITKKVDIHLRRYGQIQKRVGRELLIGFGALNLIFMGLVRANYPSGLFIVSFLLFVAGFLVSALFAFASLAGVKDQRIVVSPLYAADLIGGCVGSLFGSLILIPFLGMDQSAGLMIVFALIALLLI
jgi:hypothetical protein